MGIIISEAKDIEKLALFLEEMNNNSESHIGYCGKSKSEIYHTLVHHFSDLEIAKSFAVAYEKDEIIGAIGFDIDMENQSAEVWGPFVRNKSQYTAIADALWEKVIALSNTKIHEFSFFVNKENTFAQQFAIKKKAAYKGNHLVLKAVHSDLGNVDLHKIKPFNTKYRDSFTILHETAFPNTYYTASEILQRLSEYNQLLVMTDKDEMIKGYVYVEAKPEHKEGTIEYIAVSSNHQKQGIGTKLIQAALAHLFSFPEMEEITLSVATDNDKAIHLYKASGFHEMHELIYYLHS